MHPQWQQFLSSNYTVADSPLPLDANIMVDLSHLGTIEAKGADCDEFLQGQLTNDIRLLTPEMGQLSGYCSPKGRMLALMRMFKRDASTFMLLPQEILTPTLKRLTLFVMRSQVELTDVSTQWVCFGVSGAAAAEALSRYTPALPAEGADVVSDDQLTLLSLTSYQQRYMVFTTVERAQQIWGDLAGTFTVAPRAQWDLLDIHAGLPNIVAATVEAFVPQMVNLQALNGVNFKKGCYTGQEVVARMQYLGKLKRRMYLAHVEVPAAANIVPAAGDELESLLSSSGQGAGRIVTAAPAPTGYDLLVVAENDSVDNGTLHLKDNRDAVLTFAELPYSVEPTI